MRRVNDVRDTRELLNVSERSLVVSKLVSAILRIRMGFFFFEKILLLRRLFYWLNRNRALSPGDSCFTDYAAFNANNAADHLIQLRL